MPDVHSRKRVVLYAFILSGLSRVFFPTFLTIHYSIFYFLSSPQRKRSSYQFNDRHLFREMYEIKKKKKLREKTRCNSDLSIFITHWRGGGIHGILII